MRPSAAWELRPRIRSDATSKQPAPCLHPATWTSSHVTSGSSANFGACIATSNTFIATKGASTCATAAAKGAAAIAATARPPRRRHMPQHVSVRG